MRRHLSIDEPTAVLNAKIAKFAKSNGFFAVFAAFASRCFYV